MKHFIDQTAPYLQQFFKRAPVGVVVYRGPEFIVELVNDPVLEMWGKTLDEVKGRPLRVIFPQINTEQYIKELYEASVAKFNKGESYIVNEAPMVFERNGKPHTGYYSYIHEPLIDSMGNVSGIVAVAIEVTNQVMARKEVEATSHRLRLITDAMPALISYINKNEEYEFNNQAYNKWFGRQPDDVKGKTLIEVLGKEAYARIEPFVQKALRGETAVYESWVPYKEGSKFISASYIPDIDENKKVVGFYALVNDLTDRKQSEDALLQSEERLRMATEATSAGTFELDFRTQHLFWSDRMKLLCGFAVNEQITSEKATSIIHPGDLKLYLEVSTEMLSVNHSGNLSLNYRIVRPSDGMVRWLHSRSKTFFYNTDGKRIPAKTLGFVIDITEQKLSEQKYIELSQSLEEKVRERTTELIESNERLENKNVELSNTQSFLQQLIDSSVEYISVLDRKLRFIKVNKRYEEAIGISREQIEGRHLFEINPNAETAAEMKCIADALAGQVVHLDSKRAVAKPNLFVETYFIPLKQGAAVEGVIIMSRDVTTIVKSRESLEKLNQQLREAQRIAKVGSWELILEDNKLEWSDEMFSIYGFEEKDAITMERAFEHLPNDLMAGSKARMTDYLKNAKNNFWQSGQLIYEVQPFEFSITMPDGKIKMLRSSGKVEMSTEGVPVKLFGTLQDITEIRAAEKKLKELVATLGEKNVSLENSNKELESFSYVASHDLQEPLRKIQTFIGMIKNDTLNKKPLDVYFSKIDQAAKRMSDLINALLLYSKISNTNGQLEEVDLNTIIDDVKNDFEFRIKDQQAIIEHDHLPTIQASGYQMNQLFSNLIGNSLKFCKGKPHVRLSSAIAKGDSFEGGKMAGVDGEKMYAHISVSDNGIGFDPVFKNQIFEMFQRLENKEHFSGTGIGLSIVKKIIERHHGHIEANSKEGEGTTFEIFLPVKNHV